MLIRRAGIDDVEQLRLLYQELEEDGVRYQPEHFVVGERSNEFFQSVFESADQMGELQYQIPVNRMLRKSLL